MHSSVYVVCVRTRRVRRKRSSILFRCVARQPSMTTSTRRRRRRHRQPAVKTTNPRPPDVRRSQAVSRAIRARVHTRSVNYNTFIVWQWRARRSHSNTPSPIHKWPRPRRGQGVGVKCRREEGSGTAKRHSATCQCLPRARASPTLALDSKSTAGGARAATEPNRKNKRINKLRQRNEANG